MTKAANARRWTKLQAVAWIAFRTNAAVCKAAKLEAVVAEQDAAGELNARHKPRLTAFAALEAAAALGDFRDVGGGQDALSRVRAAMRHLGAARRKGCLCPDSDARYSSDDVRALFRSAEGRGKGRLRRTRLLKWKPRGQKVAPSVDRLARHFLTQRRDMTWDELYDWCWREALATSKRQYEHLRREASEKAQKILDAHKRWDASLSNVHAPLTEAEFQECKQNLLSWHKVGRPRKPANAVHKRRAPSPRLAGR